MFRIDTGGSGPRAREPAIGAEAVARQVLARGTPLARFARPALVNGAAGLVVVPAEKPIAVVGFTSAHGRIVAIDLIADPQKLQAAARYPPATEHVRQPRGRGARRAGNRQVS